MLNLRDRSLRMISTALKRHKSTYIHIKTHTCTIHIYTHNPHIYTYIYNPHIYTYVYNPHIYTQSTYIHIHYTMHIYTHTHTTQGRRSGFWIGGGGGGGEDQTRRACRRHEVPLSRLRSCREKQLGFCVVSHPGGYFTHSDILNWLFL